MRMKTTNDADQVGWPRGTPGLEGSLKTESRGWEGWRSSRPHLCIAQNRYDNPIDTTGYRS